MGENLGLVIWSYFGLSSWPMCVCLLIPLNLLLFELIWFIKPEHFLIVSGGVLYFFHVKPLRQVSFQCFFQKKHSNGSRLKAAQNQKGLHHLNHKVSRITTNGKKSPLRPIIGAAVPKITNRASLTFHFISAPAILWLSEPHYIHMMADLSLIWAVARGRRKCERRREESCVLIINWH